MASGNIYISNFELFLVRVIYRFKSCSNSNVRDVYYLCYRVRATSIYRYNIIYDRLD